MRQTVEVTKKSYEFRLQNNLFIYVTRCTSTNVSLNGMRENSDRVGIGVSTGPQPIGPGTIFADRFSRLELMIH